MSRFANLANKSKAKPVPEDAPPELNADSNTADQPSAPSNSQSTPNSRVGRKAISAYFTQEMSLAMHVCARRHGLSLQKLMAEAFDDVLRKYGQSPIGD
jgi:hypothetical protein